MVQSHTPGLITTHVPYMPLHITPITCLLVPVIPAMLPPVSIHRPIQIIVQYHPPAPPTCHHPHVLLHQLHLRCAQLPLILRPPRRLDNDRLAGLPIPPGSPTFLCVIQ
ncbi:uncharacterized protein ACHE_50002S [Aspergillus chevalieri]|uniref:Uncharacterized protein n=1 Tax=Aspergillus chevalieri TaxID=182096 RepID=A0A7R7VGX8_ASPCH|nr:uncharacterized protein ACHE_11943A [Aspergillus chevalieri]XP_043137326.1 uncharacterized protein ACHE_50002S [Aspergillus chevalieri]BCR84541.1 hypothetical protein ACHE_11943A [Aspergillus chevalieri]BCR88804.1 hypothetical protein ACHE_50002S [Aspergillus chevalieri]